MKKVSSLNEIISEEKYSIEINDKIQLSLHILTKLSKVKHTQNMKFHGENQHLSGTLDTGELKEEITTEIIVKISDFKEVISATLSANEYSQFLASLIKFQKPNQYGMPY